MNKVPEGEDWRLNTKNQLPSPTVRRVAIPHGVYLRPVIDCDMLCINSEAVDPTKSHSGNFTSPPIQDPCYLALGR